MLTHTTRSASSHDCPASDIPSTPHCPASNSPLTPYCNDAGAIAVSILKSHPSAATIAFDTYVDDDTMDGGPLLDHAGRELLSDVTDSENGSAIEGIIAEWSFSTLVANHCPWLTTCAETGRPQMLVRVIAERSCPSCPAAQAAAV